MPLEGQNIVVTGAAQGIGECVAEHLADRGARLFLSDIQVEKIATVAERLGVQSAPVDIADPDNVEAMVAAAIDALGHIDSFVGVAGIDAPYVEPQDVDRDHWRRLIDVDLSGPWWCVNAVLPHMIERAGGRIVLISSVSGIIATPEISPAYCAAKAGLIGLTISLSSNLERHGILINAITPGYIGTTGTPPTAAETDWYEENYPLGFGGPQPVADAVGYLLDDSGSWTSGAVMNVSGGLVRGR